MTFRRSDGAISGHRGQPIPGRANRRPGRLAAVLFFGVLASGGCSGEDREASLATRVAAAPAPPVIEARAPKATQPPSSYRQADESVCPASHIPLREIEGTTLTYPAGAVFDGPTEIFQPDGRYLLITTGGREEGRYRVCGLRLCVRVADETERCRPLERLSTGEYRSHGQTFTFTPLP